MIGHRVADQRRAKAAKIARCVEVDPTMQALHFYRTTHIDGRAYIRPLQDPMTHADQPWVRGNGTKSTVRGAWLCRFDGWLLLVAERSLFPVVRKVRDDETMGDLITRLDADLRDMEFRA